MLSLMTRPTSAALCLFATASLLGACGGSSTPPAPVAETPAPGPSTEPATDPATPPSEPATAATATPEAEPPPPPPARVAEAWTALLGRYRTDDGGFRYAALAAASGDRAALQDIVQAVADTRLTDLDGRDARLAFYLNAYNVLTVNAVVSRMPIDSVMSVPGFFDAIEHNVMGTQMTLNALENDIIRAQFQEPRIHFAVNCASVGCPWLDGSAFTAGNLGATLDRLTRAFVTRTTTVDTRRRVVVVSQLFEWFASDFEPAGGVRAFLAAHVEDEATRAAILQERNRVTYFDYDWALNARP